jgi:hypothetical protein
LSKLLLYRRLQAIIRNGENKKAGSIRSCLFRFRNDYFLNLLNPTRPIRPETRRITVLGSGTAGAEGVKVAVKAQLGVRPVAFQVLLESALKFPPLL